MTNAPSATAHIGIEYTADFSDSNLLVTSRLDYYWQDSMWTRLYNSTRDSIDSWDVINAQVIIQPTNSGMYFKIWGQDGGRLGWPRMVDSSANRCVRFISKFGEKMAIA